jgi:hypothetical protein
MSWCVTASIIDTVKLSPWWGSSVTALQRHTGSRLTHWGPSAMDCQPQDYVDCPFILACLILSLTTQKDWFLEWRENGYGCSLIITSDIGNGLNVTSHEGWILVSHELPYWSTLCCLKRIPDVLLVLHSWGAKDAFPANGLLLLVKGKILPSKRGKGKR